MSLCAIASLFVIPTASGTSDAEWESWKVEHRRRYTPTEERVRRGLWDRHMRQAAAEQAENPIAQFGATKFADWTDDEWASMHPFNGGHKVVTQQILAAPAAVAYPPPRTQGPTYSVPTAKIFADEEVRAAEAGAVDWRQKGAVTAVKDQGMCGDCWAFSAVGNMEGQWALAGNKLTELSEQEVTSCSVGHGVPTGWMTLKGCGGGFSDAAMDWLINNHNGTITSEAMYPFKSGSTHGTGQCNTTVSDKTAAKFSRYEATEYTESGGNESQMLAYMMNNGPISITVCDRTFKFYKGGLVNSCCSKCENHAVLAVGYGHDANTSTPYWIVKNSWGADWGENGYIRFKYGVNGCNIKARGAASVKV